MTIKEKKKIIANVKRNIIKLRCFEMVLILDEIESMKKYTLKSDYFFVGHSPLFSREDFDKVKIRDRFEFILNRLVSLGQMKEDDKNYIVKAVDFRNHIGHRTHQLFLDLSDEPLDGLSYAVYKNDFLLKIKEAHKKLERVLMRYVVSEVNFLGALASPMLDEIEKEVLILKRRINKYIDRFNEIK